MIVKILPYIAFITTLFIGCNNKPENVTPVINSDWNIPVNEVFDGGPGKDGIPALLDPIFINAVEENYLTDASLVLGYKEGDEVRAYPHQILNWHEIINDNVNNHQIAVTYCPLTGTGIGWEREYNGSVTTFGVSGLLYNSNLIPYDRNTDSYWSQMKLECVTGELKDEKVNTFNLVETSWKTWKNMFPETKVVSTQTQYNRNYFQYPYGDYRTNNNLLFFPISKNDFRLPAKDRVLGIIINDKVKVYQFDNFDTDPNALLSPTSIIHDTFEGKNIMIIGNKDSNFVVAFEETDFNGTTLEFFPVQDSGKIIIADNEGGKWNIFGHAIEGNRIGAKLTPIESYIGFWFSFATFYPNPEIYEE